LLDDAAQWTCAELIVIAFIGESRQRRRRRRQRKVVIFKPLRYLVQFERDDLLDVSFVQRAEDDDAVESVQEFRAETFFNESVSFLRMSS